jgi:Rrf2 family cysteine metabolism transcriptional repressor
MLTPSKKGQYALRAIYELAKRTGEGPIKISDIADAQGIPRRFLEVILNQLKGSGFVESKRGFYGGYVLAKTPDKITVGDVIRYMQKDHQKRDCLACGKKKFCPLGRCAFLYISIWLSTKLK